MSGSRVSRVVFGASISLVLLACEGGGLPEGWAEAPSGSGPRIVWDLEAEPLPEIPLPNDVATYPDPTSPSGRRVNASLVAPSGMESRLREEFDRLDGWGTFSPISVRFEAPLDIGELSRRQGRGQLSADDWPRHAVYLIDMETGIPVPLDVGSDLYPRVVARPDAYYDNDPRGGESNLLFETVEEDLNGNGVLDPGEDTDFDGVLDHPNTVSGRVGSTDTETLDDMLWFYERETDTLLVRPILPLEEQRRYVVVLTDRLVGLSGSPVRSPFREVHHLSQKDDLESLPDVLAAHPELYGDLASRGWSGVAFAWSFTTQSVSGDLTALRDGLYGRGPFAHLADEFPTTFTPSPLRGGTRADPCDAGSQIYIVTPTQLGTAISGLPVDSLGFPVEQLDAVIESLERSVAYMAFGWFESPYLLGDPEDEHVEDTWQIDRASGEGRVERDLVPMFIIVPKETETHHQPFTTTFYAHGYGSLNLEALAFAGSVANHGVATVSIDAQAHGIPLGNELAPILASVLGTNCLAPLGTALSIDRARDLNGDSVPDSAGLYYSAYMFHTRDAMRQSTLDWMQAIRVVRSWDGHPDYPSGRPWTPGETEPEQGRPLVFTGDVNGDGTIDREGDFDGNGVPDLGGWDRPYGQWGSSLGGIQSMMNIGVEPAIVAAAPVSGGGGMFDIGLRTSLGTARHPIWLRVLGPILASQPVSEPSANSACSGGQRSVFFRVPDLSSDVTVEVACIGEEVLREGDAVFVTNLRNGETRCAGVGPDGRFRTQLPSDAADPLPDMLLPDEEPDPDAEVRVADPLQILIFDRARDQVDYATCTFLDGAEPAINDTIDTWRSPSGTSEGECPRCSHYLGTTWEVGDPLVAPAEGLGLRRQSPDLRRLAGLAQIALDPGDPINYARRVFLDPPTDPEITPRPRSIMVLASAGDTTVPPSSSAAFARAAGILPFMPPDAPDAFIEHRAPARFADTYGYATPDDVLITYHVLEGLSRLNRHPVMGAPQFLFDVDDMSEGRQFFDPDGEHQLAEADGGIRPNRLSPPLRWGRESHSAIDGDPWRTDSGTATSMILNVLTVPVGQHVFLPVDPTKGFDESEYMLNVIGWYIASAGTELPWNVLPDPFCLETSSCIRE
ncbi:MAG: hypothetical protein AB7S26_22010 [Sandaracinaceae bacterium]